MTTTTWIPHAASNRHKGMWLLTDGTVVESPDVETTTSERRFRVAGTSVTGYKKDIDSMIWQAVQNGAAANKAAPWVYLGSKTSDSNPVNINAEKPDSVGRSEAKLAFTGNGNFQATTLRWRFRHPSMPLDAVLVTSLQQNRYRTEQWHMTTQLMYPSTNPAHAMQSCEVTLESGESWPINWQGIDRYQADGVNLESWASRHTDEMPPLPWGTTVLDSEREGIKALAKMIRLVDDLESLKIPDLRDIHKPGFLELGLLHTNVTQRFVETLSDYLNSGPVVERVFEAWQEIVRNFRSVGIVVGDIKKSDLYQLMTHQNKPVEVKIGPTTEEKGDTVINTHSVTFDLATGTIAVVCSGNQHLDEVATEYEAAKIRATLTGTKDELLAYAEEYARRRATAKAKDMVAEAKKRDKKEPF